MPRRPVLRRHSGAWGCVGYGTPHMTTGWNRIATIPQPSLRSPVPALTIKGIPERLLERLRHRAAQERRSLNQQVIQLIEQALADERRGFTSSYGAFLGTHGPSPLEDESLEDLRSREPGRPAPFEEPGG